MNEKKIVHIKDFRTVENCTNSDLSVKNFLKKPKDFFPSTSRDQKWNETEEANAWISDYDTETDSERSAC